MAAEITETGTGGLRGLPGLNQRNDILDQIMSEDLNRYNPRNNQGIGIQAAQVGYGDSQYDDAVTSVNQFDNLNDVRYNEQPWYDVLANSVGKMLGTAATTFMNSTIGMPVGLYTAAKEKRWSGLWDNEFTQAMGEVDDSLEKNMTNYKSEYQQENPWWNLANLGSMTQIGDGLIKNAGFMLGAAAAGATGAGALGLMSRAMGFVNKVKKGTSFGVKLASSLLAATGEGMIEARQGVEERNKLLFQQLDDEMNPEYSALAREQQEANALYDMVRGQNEYYNPETGRVEDPAYTAWRASMDDIARRRQELDTRKKAATDEIIQSGRLMGNKILLGNQILLSLGNFIQFGKAFAKSFDNARHVAQTVNKAAAPSLASAVRAGKEIADGWKIANKNLGRLVAGTKGLVTEGSEEMNQQWLSSSAGAYYNREDVNDYWKARLDPDALKDVSDGSYSIGQAIGKGWSESWGDPEQWEQFVIGAITGGMGTVMPTKVFNQDKSKSVWNPMRYLSWEGGAYNEIKEYNDKLRAYESNINDLNNVVKQQDFASRFQRLGAHTALQNLKAYAELTGDKKLWKDADDKQTIHDIQAFVRAGKVDDLKSLYQELGADLSDAELDKLIKDTSWDISAQQDKENHVNEANSKISEEQEKINSLQQQMSTLDRQAEQNKDNAEELAKIDEQRRNLRVEMAQHSKNIGDLTQDRDSYEGEASKGGVFLTEDGNLASARENIRETIRHNIEELDRKLDSYLESVKQVQDDTGGRLTKDQEDNLAYLHNMGKESEVRFKKIMADKRKDMPKRFLLKTNKTPEQLTQQYVASDLSFEVDSTTPDGYVEVDTTKMDDNAFASFFMTEVMWGGNISPEFGETAEEKEQREKDKNDKSLSDEERKKRAMERFTAKMEAEDKRMQDDVKKQRASNYARMRDFFIENYRKNNNATVEETRKAWEEIVQSVKDASDLLNQASQYRVTLSEYMNNPQKIDEDKKKAEEKLNKSKGKEQVKGMSINDLTDRDDLDELLKQAEKEKDIDLINKIRKAKVLRNKRASIEAAESDESKYKDLDPADRDAAFEILRRQVENDIADDSAPDHEATMKEFADQVADVDQGIIDDYIDTHAIVNIDTKTGKKTLVLKQEETNPAERAQLAQFETDNPEEYEKQRDLLRSKLRNIITPMDLELRKVLDKIINVDDIAEDAAQAQAQAYTNQMQIDENFQDEQPEKKDDRNNPVQVVPIKAEAPAEKAPVDGIGESGILDADMQQGTTSGMQTASDGGQHPWYSVSGRVGYHTNESYSDTLHKLLNDPNISEEKKAQYRKQFVRAIAVEEFLKNDGAYTRVENGEVQRGTKIRFKVFKSVNEKAKDFVIFMVDDKGRVLADLPSSDADIDPNTEKRTGLAELYEEARRQFLDSGADEVELQGIETEADNIYIGKPQYQDERQTLGSLFKDNNFTIALKVADASDDNPRAFLDTGKKSLQGKLERDAIKDPLTGSLGQPYVLILTSQSGNKRNFKRGYVAVPIATPTFGELDPNSIFYRTVRQTLEDIRDGKLSETEAKTKLGELFGLANFHVNFDSKDSRKGAGIRATTYIRQDGSEKGAPHTLHIGDRASMDVDAILGELGKFFINIANSRINSNGTYTTVDGKSYTYNQMIGQIATTNAARTHTVNDWFTVRPVEKNGNKWEMSKTPTPRIPYPSGSKNSVFNVSVQYKDGTSQMWTISPQDWVVRDEKGRAIYKGDSVHSDAEVNTAAIHMALAFGRYYMKPMDRPYAIQVGNRAMMFDPTTNTFKTAKELEESPKYKKGTSFNSLSDEYDYLVGQEDDRIEGFEMAKAQKAAQQQPAVQVSPQQIVQDMITHIREMGVPVHNREELIKFLEENGYDDILEAIEESREMQAIKEKAIADGTFMKAPNGNSTNLTERQWLQVRTKNFINWFGDWINDPANASKVVDENGEPLVVYHYSDNETLTEFSTDFDNYFSQSGGTKKAIFFTEDNPSEEERGSNFLTKRKNKIAAFLNIKDLKTYKGTKEDLHNQGTSYREVVNKSAEENNLDGGVHMEDFDDNKKEHQSIWIVHNPSQIKSATDNNGEFSTEDNNIQRFQTPEGEVYGFVAGVVGDGEIYLDETVISPEHPMHEYTHLWDAVIQEADPRLWARGKKLMQTEAADLWKEIAESENYGKKWEAQGFTEEVLEDLIASEVHARLVGEGFDKYVKKHPTGTFAQLKQWLLDAFKSLARTLGMTDEQIEKLTLADFNNMTVRDFMEKSGPKAIQEKAANIRNSEALVEKIKSDSSNYVLADANGNENPNGAYYKDNRTGQLHARVTSIKEGDTRVQPFNETDSEGKPNPWILPSTSIGNAVDEFVRAFFAGEDPEASPLSQNLSDATKKHLREELQKIRTSVEKGGWKIVSNGIVASGTILVKDANGDKMAVRVAGTLDLFLYNPERDEYAIYDMKTHRSPVDSQKEIDWAAQLSLYKQLLEAKFPELRGKIKGLRILPFSTSGYDALKQNYESDAEGRLTSNGNVVKAEVKYDGKTIDLTGKEMNLDISFARPGFKKEYVEGEGAQKIVVDRPQPKTGEALKEKVKEGLVKTINKIVAGESVKDYIKSAFKKNNEAQALAEKIDIARKNGSLGDLCLTAAEMSLLQDMLNERKINSRAAFEATKGAGIETQEDNLPNAEVAEEGQKTIDDIATEKGILTSATKNAWNRLTDENKEKVVKLRRGIKNVKEELKNCQRLGKDPNAAISGYLHRKADETSGYTMIDMKKEMAWLDKVLPQLSRENKIRIVEGLIKCSDGTWSYGQMKNNLIYLANRGKEGTIYHEAFHAITQWILTDEELDRLYDVAKARYGNLDIVTLEEKLADDFMLYTMGLEPSYKRRDMNIFKRLWQAIRNMFRNTSMIDKLYRDINDGIYADRVLRTEGNVFSSIGEEDRQVSMKYNFLDKEQKQRLRDGGVNKRQYEVLDTDEKRYLFHCVL